MHVVVLGAVDQHQLAAQVLRRADHRGALVALLVLLRGAHVALGVDRVVEPPVVHAGAGEPERELVAVGQRVGRHEAAVAPAADRDALGVPAELGADVVDSVLQVLELLHPELPVARAGVLLAAPRRRAHVALQDDEALLRQELVVGRVRPAVPHRRRVRPRVGRQEHRVALARLPVGRQLHRGVERVAVARGDAEPLLLAERVVLRGPLAGAAQLPQLLAGLPVEHAHDRRVLHRGPAVEHVAAVGAERERV